MKKPITIIFGMLCAVIMLAGIGRPLPARSQAMERDRARNQPVAPFRIMGNLYYVGASDITSFLIVTPKGNILLDAGFLETVTQIQANVKTLSFRLEDTKFLLNSQAHFDHTGGLAQLKKLTGAQMVASEEDALMLESGGRGDPYFGDKYVFPPVQVDRRLQNGETVSLGGTVMTAEITPGHTRGCTTWTMSAEDAGKPYHAVFVCSTSVLPEIRLIDNAQYPGIERDYEYTFRRLRQLPCDIFLGAHGNFFDLLAKTERLRRGDKPNPFIDPEGYKKYLDSSEAAFQKELRVQRAAVSRPPADKPHP
ncbi:MAG: subclass B3 metallo-beta-lactamase [Candidatus Acidiferrales bacterium]